MPTRTLAPSTLIYQSLAAAKNTFHKHNTSAETRWRATHTFKEQQQSSSEPIKVAIELREGV
jgi:hypothetical protein